jgi:hypothetical protein
MLTEKQIYAQFSQLPEHSQAEVLHYIQFLISQPTRRIPHRPLSSPKPRKRTFGSVPGKYQLATNFDAPLEDFKDYLP